MKTFDTVIFDLGGVLIDWSPDYVYKTIFDDEKKMHTFYKEVCTPDWNEMQDGGRGLEEATEELVARFPHEEQNIRAYYGRWEEMLGGPIEKTVEILKQLKTQGGFKLYALTNGSSETFPVALKKFEFLHWFDGRLVSGEEKMRKPFPEFYELILKRFDLKPAHTLFIDDNLRNIIAAEVIGIQCIHFISPMQLKTGLIQMGARPAQEV